MDTKKVTSVFTEKVGPLPAIAWAGIAVTVYVAYRYISQSKTATTPTAAVDPSSVYTAPYDATTGYGNATGTFNAGQSTANDVYVAPAIADNQTWYRRVTSWLIAQGVDPTLAAATISNYLSGDTTPINDTQHAALSNALTQFGVPPEGLLTPPPTTTVTPVPAPIPEGHVNPNNGLTVGKPVYGPDQQYGIGGDLKPDITVPQAQRPNPNNV